MKFSVCLDSVFDGIPLEESLEIVNEAGHGAVEFWGWWNKDYRLIARETEKRGLKIAAFCTKFVSLTDGSRRDAFLDGLWESVAVAVETGCPVLIAQVGADTGAPRGEQRANAVETLKRSAEILEKTEVTLAFEPLNPYNHPGYFLVKSKEAFEMAAEVGSGRVKVLFDIYHQQLSEGDLMNSIITNLPGIAHFHAAGCPGRHELSEGEIRYEWLLLQIERAGYAGYVGLEFFPKNQNKADLTNWLREVM